MIRRAAKRNSDAAVGFVVDGLKKTDESENQTYNYVFENSSLGVTTDEPSAGITFTDGSPAIVPNF